MDDLSFTVHFHGPFLIATGDAHLGFDTAADHTNPLPATTLKGVMRDSLEQLRTHLSIGPAEVDAVFGAAAQPSAWSWTDATVHEPLFRERARVRIDAGTGTADPGSLQFADEVWADSATFKIAQREPLDSKALDRQRNLLVIAGAGVHAIGSDRRRGRGWVTILPGRNDGHDVEAPGMAAIEAAIEAISPDDGGAR